MLKRWTKTLLRRPEPEAAPSGLRIPPGTRVYAVGDVHGRRDLLARLCGMIERDLERAAPQEATIVFLGDYVDRGPDSRGVLDYFLSTPLPAKAVFLRGNHEAMLLDFLFDPEVGLLWRRFGGIETLHSYGIDVADFRLGQNLDAASRRLAETLPAIHRDFLDRLPLSYELGSFFFCHAGIRPGVPIAQQREEDLLWIRDEFNDSNADFGCVVVHGHTPGEEPVVRPNRIGVDTGAYITGRLTCAVLDSAGLSFLAT